MEIHRCIVCGFVYDDTLGRPADGLAAGTLWSESPARVGVPVCGVAKADVEGVVSQPTPQQYT
ncbi:MAG: rubredoxin [Burkholderiaceae bacterium]